MSRVRSTLIHLALAGASLSGALVAAELGVRLLVNTGILRERSVVFPRAAYTSPMRNSANQRLFWELNPESPLVNAAGFRDREFALVRTPGTFRIVALGDSVTFGRGVPLAETWVKVLERALNPNSPEARRTEVLNFGVGGYNTDQEVELYRSRARHYEPDLVIVGYVLNDPLSAAASLRVQSMAAKKPAVAKKEGEGDAPSAPAFRNAIADSVLVRMVRNLFGPLGGRPTMGAPRFPKDFHADPEKWAIVTHALDELATITAEDRTAVLVVIFPLLIQLDEYPYREVHEQVARAAQARGFDVLDLHPVLREWDAEDLRLTPEDSSHPNAAAHGVVAAAIHDHLRSRRMLPDAP